MGAGSGTIGVMIVLSGSAGTICLPVCVWSMLGKTGLEDSNDSERRGPFMPEELGNRMRRSIGLLLVGGIGVGDVRGCETPRMGRLVWLIGSSAASLC